MESNAEILSWLFWSNLVMCVGSIAGFAACFWVAVIIGEDIIEKKKHGVTTDCSTASLLNLILWGFATYGIFHYGLASAKTVIAPAIAVSEYNSK